MMHGVHGVQCTRVHTCIRSCVHPLNDLSFVDCDHRVGTIQTVYRGQRGPDILTFYQSDEGLYRYIFSVRVLSPKSFLCHTWTCFNQDNIPTAYLDIRTCCDMFLLRVLCVVLSPWFFVMSLL